MTQALLDLWMSQSSQGETQFINRDLSEKMLISEIESKNQGFVDTTAAFHRACAQSRLPHIKVTPPSRLPTIKVAPLHVTQPQCKLSCRRVYQEVLIEDRKDSGFVDETVQSDGNPVHQQRPKRKNVDF